MIILEKLLDLMWDGFGGRYLESNKRLYPKQPFSLLLCFLFLLVCSFIHSHVYKNDISTDSDKTNDYT